MGARARLFQSLGSPDSVLLLLDGGDLALCRKEDLGPHPHPLSWAPLVKLETHFLRFRAVPSVSSFPEAKGDLPPEYREEAESFPVFREPQSS